MLRSSLPTLVGLLAGPAIALFVAACTDVSTVRVGPVAAPRALDCSLELIDVAPQAGVPAGLELLGYVRVIHEEGRSPNDPQVLALLKPEVCKLGGEQVSSGMSLNFTNGLRSGSSLTYTVWRHKVAAAAPTRF